MAANEVVQAGIAAIYELLNQEIRDILSKFDRKSRKRRFWVRTWILRRHKLGVSGTLFKELALEDKDAYKNHLRMSEEQFQGLLLKIKSKIQKQDTIMRRSISAKIALISSFADIRGSEIKSKTAFKHENADEQLRLNASFFFQKRPTLDRMFASTSQRNDDGLRASYNNSLLIAKSGKPHTIGEKLILSAVEEVLKTVLHKPASDIIKRIPLSNNTVERRIDEMSSDIENFLCNYLQTTNFSIQLDESTLPDNAALLLAYVRFIMNQEIYEELLFARTLITDTKAKSGKPHTIGEKLILTAVEEALKTVSHKPASDIIKRIPLSNNTVERRINEMSSDIESFLCNYLQTTHFSIQLDESTLPDNAALLLAYVRFNMNQEIYEELLFARTLITDTKELQSSKESNMVSRPSQTSMHQTKELRGYLNSF
ncbi:unnamed protein product [Acanthoscelides obtectus]|uniref:Uncharacterized protein n=1 Tax=Acanthoscelides obtectus TaxID=200917 RepID=A0A9P0MIW6_ACAOB|nr:unnamed protein product [Acanthoscelides obtectus]CAK1619887.1 SCAN domain-containing protein 3 [Acanthoscelides obtectus]